MRRLLRALGCFYNELLEWAGGVGSFENANQNKCTAGVLPFMLLRSLQVRF